MRLIPFSEIKSKSVDYVWDPYIATGKITLFGGYAGVGKTWACNSLVAKLSRGLPLPGQERGAPPRRCLLASTEDDEDDTLKPRLECFGADMNNVIWWDDPVRLDETCLKQLARAADDLNITFFHIDSVQAWMKRGTNSKEQNDVREFLTDLRARLLRSRDSAAIITMHYRKPGRDGGKQSGPAYNQLHGSTDFAGTARSVLLAVEDGDGRTYICHDKCNYARKGPTWEYHLLEARPYFEWGGTDPRDARAIMTSSGKRDSKKTEVAAWLEETVPVMGMPSAELEAAALRAGHSWATVKEVRRALGWKSQKEGSVWWTHRAGH